MSGWLGCPGRWIVAVAMSAVLVAAADAAWAADRDVLLQRFDTLKANSIKAFQQGKVQTIEAKVKGDGDKFVFVGQAEIPPAPPIVPAGPPLALGVKIWGQLLDGRFVNLEKHKWQRSEPFYLWLEPAVPIQLAFFQNYPEGRPPSRQVSPDERFPQTFATIMPGVPYRLPVLIQMDDDLRDELMSIVVVRADAQVLPINGAPVVEATATAVATAIVETPAGRVIVEAEAFAGVMGPGGTLKAPVTQKTKEIMGALNTYARTQPKAKSARMKLNLQALPPPAAPVISASFEDVAVLLMGPGNIAQIELTLHKD